MKFIAMNSSYLFINKLSHAQMEEVTTSSLPYNQGVGRNISGVSLSLTGTEMGSGPRITLLAVSHLSPFAGHDAVLLRIQIAILSPQHLCIHRVIPICETISNSHFIAHSGHSLCPSLDSFLNNLLC